MSAAVRNYFRDRKGAAAAEFAMFAIVLAPLLLNLVDIGYYAYVRMEVENAAQAGAQAAWANCTASTPSSANCPNLSTAVTNAIQSTTLGSGVTWTNSSNMWSAGSHPYGVDTYCPDSATNSLVFTNSTSTCSSTTSTNTSPGTYVKIVVTYTFTPLFRGATVANLFSSTISRTTYQRLI